MLAGLPALSSVAPFAGAQAIPSPAFLTVKLTALLVTVMLVSGLVNWAVALCVPAGTGLAGCNPVKVSDMPSALTVGGFVLAKLSPPAICTVTFQAGDVVGLTPKVTT